MNGGPVQQVAKTAIARIHDLEHAEEAANRFASLGVGLIEVEHHETDGNERRKRQIPVAIERRSGKDRRHGERRRQIDPTTCERDYSEEEIAFMKAMDQYKRDNRRPFPTWSEVLEVLRALGYRKVAEPTVMPGLQPTQGRRNDDDD